MVRRSIIQKGGEERDEERGTGREADESERTQSGRRMEGRREPADGRRKREGTGEGANGEAAEGRRGRRHPSPWFFLFALFFLSALLFSSV